MKTKGTSVLLALFFVLAGCSNKASYYMSKPIERFGAYQKPQKAIRSAELMTPAAPSPASEALTAALVPVADAPAPAPKSKSAMAGAMGATDQEGPARQFVHVPAKVAEPHNDLHDHYQTPPKPKKKQMIGKVEAGFALSLFGVISIALLFISPYFLYFSGLLTLAGLILSFIGLGQVKKGKGKFRGKVRGWVGVVLGLLGTALVVFLLNDRIW